MVITEQALATITSSARPGCDDHHLAERAYHIRLVLSDCDGVLTDTGVYYSEHGEELKRFSIRDGMGVELLRHAGIQTGIISGEDSPAVKRRAEKLRLPFLYLGIQRKQQHLDKITQATGYTLAQIAYIGDDVNDLEAMATIRAQGLTGAPADAMRSVLSMAHYHCTVPGGHGAFREFADWLLAMRRRGIHDTIR